MRHFLKKNVLRFLSLSYSADFRRSRLVFLWSLCKGTQESLISTLHLPRRLTQVSRQSLRSRRTLARVPHVNFLMLQKVKERPKSPHIEIFPHQKTLLNFLTEASFQFFDTSIETFLLYFHWPYPHLKVLVFGSDKVEN